MNEKIDKAIENTLAMIRANGKCDDALKFSQAVLNLANAKRLLEVGKPIKGSGS